MIMSTGIATLEEIQYAVDACHKAGNNDITLLKCTSAYSAPLNEANLLTIPDMQNILVVRLGYQTIRQAILLPVQPLL